MSHSLHIQQTHIKMSVISGIKNKRVTNLNQDLRYDRLGISKKYHSFIKKGTV